MSDSTRIEALFAREGMPWAARASLRCWRTLSGAAWAGWYALAGVLACASAGSFVVGVVSLTNLASGHIGAVNAMPAWMMSTDLFGSACSAGYCFLVYSGLGRTLPRLGNAMRLATQADIQALDEASQEHPWLIEFMEARGVDAASVAGWRKGSVNWLLAVVAVVDAALLAQRRAQAAAAKAAAENAACKAVAGRIAERIEALRTARGQAARLAGGKGQERRRRA